MLFGVIYDLRCLMCNFSQMKGERRSKTRREKRWGQDERWKGI